MSTRTIRTIRAKEVQKEIKVMKKATKEICRSKKSTQEYLLKSGFIIPSPIWEADQALSLGQGNATAWHRSRLSRL